MHEYKFGPKDRPGYCVLRLTDNAAIPLDMSNRDCALFLQEWQAGATVYDGDTSSSLRNLTITVPYDANLAANLGLVAI